MPDLFRSGLLESTGHGTLFPAIRSYLHKSTTGLCDELPTGVHLFSGWQLSNYHNHSTGKNQAAGSANKVPHDFRHRTQFALLPKHAVPHSPDRLYASSDRSHCECHDSRMRGTASSLRCNNATTMPWVPTAKTRRPTWWHNQCQGRSSKFGSNCI